MSSDAIDTTDGAPGEKPPDAGGDGPGVRRGEYTWKHFMREHGHEHDIEAVYRQQASLGSLTRFLPGNTGSRDPPPEPEAWDRVEFEPASYLGCAPHEFERRVARVGTAAAEYDRAFRAWIDETPVVKDEYTWEHFKWEYYYEDGSPPRPQPGIVEPFTPEDYLGFHPDDMDDVLEECAENATELLTIENLRTVNVNPTIDEDEFFTTDEGTTTLVNRYDLEKAVSMQNKQHFFEEQRYWVNKPFSFVIIFHSAKENEKKYYAVKPYCNEIEADLIDFFAGKLRTRVKYSDNDAVVQGTDEERAAVLKDETEWLIDRYNLRSPASDDQDGSLPDQIGVFHGYVEDELVTPIKTYLNGDEPADESDDEEEEPARELEGIMARPEPAVLAEDPDWLTEYQVAKILHRIRRDFIGYGPINPIKHDINVEDISCDGYNSPVFVYHTDYENVITNVQHGKESLDSFVIKLAQRSGKGISKRQPQVDATLPDGSRAQLTLGSEVSDHGTNYTIRQFNDVPFTPVDLINWRTFSLDEIGFLWLCIESRKSLIFSGGTASGKTTSLNAVSLFIPSNTKIVSIEDTREVELPQRNWVASVTRPSFTQDNTGEVNEFDLLEAALRQRPEYIVMGEVRGEEGRTLFQVMSTGHTTYTTFHADNVDEVLKRFTTDPINVSKTLFTALDLISVQTQTRVDGQKVRRNKTITEINSYDAQNDEISVQDVYQWRPDEDEFYQHGDSKKLQEIAFDRGWSRERLENELFTRKALLSYLIVNDLNTYTEVAATIQAFANDPETILTLIANDELEESLRDLREMESVLIDVDPQKEALVPRPEPDAALREEAQAILDEAEDRIFAEYQDRHAGSIVQALPDLTPEEDVTVESASDRQLLAMLDPEVAEPWLGPDGLDDTHGRLSEAVAESIPEGEALSNGNTTDDTQHE